MKKFIQTPRNLIVVTCAVFSLVYNADSLLSITMFLVCRIKPCLVKELLLLSGKAKSESWLYRSFDESLLNKL